MRALRSAESREDNMTSHMPGWQILVDDARLREAAPTMLAALKLALPTLAREDWEAYKAADAAIAKATGAA